MPDGPVAGMLYLNGAGQQRLERPAALQSTRPVLTIWGVDRDE